VISPGTLAIDASVAVKWYVPETGHAAAAAILERGDPLVAPDLLVAEFGNVLWKKVRRGELSQSESEAIIDAFTSSCPIALQPSGPVLPAAFKIASQCGCTVYDALYVAVAIAQGCPASHRRRAAGPGLA